MPTPVILAIDAGTTGVTCVLVDQTATVRARAYREFPQYFPSEGRVEHDLNEIWSATIAGIRELAALDFTITAVGLTNQRETACWWDRETLGAPRRAIVWQDRRTAGMCQALREAGHEPEISRRTGLRLDPYFTATKITWVRDNDAMTWAHVESGRVAIGTVDSYLVARMTRGLEHITDATNASRTLLYDLETGDWSEELCALFGVPMEALPHIGPSYGSLARTDPSVCAGLDVPITGIAGDQQAALVGQAGTRRGMAKCTYGTGSFLLAHTGSTAVQSRHGLLTTVALEHPDGNRDFALEGAVFVTGSAVQWLRDGLGIISDAADSEELARTVPDAGGVVFVPALTGLGAPDWDPNARGLIIGLTRGTTAGHLARATLEAIAYEVRDVVSLMALEAGITFDSLAIDGGAAANNLLCQLQADQLQIPVDRSRELQTTALGAAFLAGVGSGMWPSLAALQDVRHSDHVFMPHARNDEGWTRWRRAVERSKNWID